MSVFTVWHASVSKIAFNYAKYCDAAYEEWRENKITAVELDLILGFLRAEEQQKLDEATRPYVDSWK